MFNKANVVVADFIGVVLKCYNKWEIAFRG